MPEPTKIPRPFADSGDKNSIPDSSGGIGFASWQEGFPAITSEPFAQGGVAPKRADFNGIFNALSLATVWQQQGGVYAYDATTDYEVGNVVEYSGDLYKCITANGPSSTVKDPTDTTVWDAIATASGYLPLSGGRMTGTIVAITHPALSRQNDNSYLTLCGGTAANVSNGAFMYLYGANSGQPGAFRIYTGGTSHNLFGKSDGTLTWDGNELAPKPQISGVGQWVRLFANASSIDLPSGGTWAYYVLGVNSSNDLIYVNASVAAGGTNIINNASVTRCYGFCWRIA